MEYTIAGVGLLSIIMKVTVTVVLEGFFDKEDRLRR